MEPIRTKKSRAALEEAIQILGHPCAVADLNSFSKKSPARNVFLDSTFIMCRDMMLTKCGDLLMEMRGQGIDHLVKSDMTCPLAKAMRAYGSKIEEMPQRILSELQTWLTMYGRPAVPKYRMLQEHEQRLWNFKQYDQERRKNGNITHRSTSRSVTKDTGRHISNKFKWEELLPIPINELKLFEIKKGKYLEGKLLIDPFTPMVGCTTILEDKNGDVLIIALYNFLPNGVSGSDADPIASAKIPKGCTVRIAEPFLKVFKDGGRGIRIDNPADITVVLQDKRVDGKEDDCLEKYKGSGNALFQKELYVAAIDSYLDGLRHAEFIPTLLSNRSQAFIMMQDWRNALADASASLTIRPGCKKSWARYQKALDGLELTLDKELPMIEKRRILVKAVLLSRVDIDTTADDENDTSEYVLKNNGNTAFKKKVYEKAVYFYSMAISLAGKNCRALLSNWSQCCLNIGSINDCLAGAAASLRIGFDEKALYRLCQSLLLLAEPSISSKLIQNHPKSGSNSSLAELLDVSNRMSIALDSNELLNPLFVASVPSRLLPYKYQSIETFDAGRKGRGVRAKIDIASGTVVIIEHPVATAESNPVTCKKIVTSVGTKTVTNATQNELCETIIFRSQREALLTNILDKLSDGVNPKPLVPFMELVPHILSTPLLLPSHHEYMDGKRTTLTSTQVQGLISTNSFGSNVERDERKNETEHTSLYPAISMFNHSKDPTCASAFFGKKEFEQTTILVTRKSVQAGEELTLSYHPVDAVVRAGWGIE